MNYSIITPHKNAPQLLERCLNSIPQREDLEVIIVDDHSDVVIDGASVPSIERKDVRLVQLEQSHGAGYSRNTAVKLATGKWLMFADADDYFSEDILQYAVAYSIPFIIGIRIKTLSEKNKVSKLSCILIVLCLAGVIYSFANNGLDISWSYKFSPRSCFILYGVLMCVVAWITRRTWSKKKVDFGLFSWIGRNTIWIYLWHMPIVLCANYLFDNWLIKYLLVYCLSVNAFFVQYSIVKRSNNSYAKKYLVG